MTPTANILTALLTAQVEMTSRIGYPSLVERFVLRNARAERQGAIFTGRRGTPKECYRNAALYAERHGATYVEGFGYRVGVLPIPIAHAWCVDQHGSVVDPTWDRPETSIYLGVEIPIDLLRERLIATEHYGLFANGIGMIYAADVLFRFDPGLREEVEAFRRAAFRPPGVQPDPVAAALVADAAEAQERFGDDALEEAARTAEATLSAKIAHM